MKTRLRALLVMLALAVLPAPLAVGAQPAATAPRIGYLTQRSSPGPREEAFRQGLRELGYAPRKYIVIEERYSAGLDGLNARAAELVRLKVQLIVTAGPAATRSAKAATSTIPIVMAQDSDPVGNGFVTNLARPGGHITGLSGLYTEINGKRLELLKEVVPRLSRVAVFGNSSEPGNARALRETAGPGLWLRVKRVLMPDGGEMPLREEPVYFLRWELVTTARLYDALPADIRGIG